MRVLTNSARSLTLAALCAALVWVAQGQTEAADPAFEVATVKVSVADNGNWSTSTGKGQFRLVNIPLQSCIQMAYDVKDYSLDGPAWLDSARFDIVAKPPAGTPLSQFNQMLRSLLVERFKLTFHREAKLLNGYALSLAKNGLKIQPAEPGLTGMGSGTGSLSGRGVSMVGIADQLSRQLNLPVQDFTGVVGVFDYKLRWTPDAGAPNMMADGQEHAAADPGPSVFSALQEQLGLKLEARKVPVDVLVIDHVEKTPIEN
jgi:uncharacterized protein (TIGR03435 family)